jgi:hypothetical protein
VHINAHWQIKGVFNNLVNLFINWVKTAGSMPDAAMILGLFSQKNLKINIDRKLY